ncbi:MAG: MFS transporter [Acidobacteriota bacterium]|nr:MFS transporter [Acidobacteriota bacterium]
MVTNLAPTHVRWKIVVFLAVVAGLTYVDRLNLGIVAKYVLEDYKFTTQQMGWILGSFSLGYAIFHVPGGWLADRYGPGRVLAAAILWFSIFTGLTAIAPILPIVGWLGPVWAFAVVRFTMGLGEAAAMPVGNKMMAYWLGEKELGFGTSIFLAGVGGGGIVAPIFITWLIKHWGWRASFFISGGLGAVLAIVCYFYVTSRPEEHPHVNAAELALVRQTSKTNAGSEIERAAKVPWVKILSAPSIWGLMISHFCLVYPVYIFFTWFFIYMLKTRGVTISKASLWGSAPFVANVIMVPLWGWLTDRAVEMMGKRMGRKTTAWLGIACSAALLWSGSHTANNTLALLQLALAAGFNFAASAVLWTTCNDISAKFSGSISGTMSTFGSLGGWLSPVLTGLIAAKFGWSYALDVAAGITIVSGFAWFFIDASKPILAD